MDYTSRPQNPGPRGALHAAFLAAAVLGGGCDRTPPEPPRPNVVLVIVDTLRADHLGAYGYHRPTSPRLDAFAEEAFLFEDARAQAPCTFPSANSILTGRFPTHFVGQPEKRLGIPEAFPSLAEVLSGAGYATAAVSASPIVRATPSENNPHGGFGRGFDRFNEECLWSHAGCVNRRARTFLDELPEPFFLYLHYMDPHGPYRPPPAWKRLFAPEDGAPAPGVSEAAASGDPNPMAKALYEDGDTSLITPESLERLIDLYDDEIAYFDSRFDVFLRDLRQRGLLDRTILVLVADHGESFFEHRHLKHCRTVFDTEVKTPLLVRLPPELAATEPRRIPTQAANLDVVPTVLDYLEIPAAELAIEGTSLRPLLEGDSEAVRPPVFSAWGGLRAVKDGPFKLVYRLGTGETRLYHLERDPAETRNVAPAHPRETRTLLRALSRWQASLGPGKGGAAADQEAIERLRGLGYLQ
ncbi:MAG TPA: sulfatase [Thermoanaerobaculia bacterium]|nr:sulfatase [Thermoanaerobaculia bacterium]